MTRERGQLAILGGRPAFEAPVHTGRPFIGNREELYKRLDTVLDTRRLTNNGPMVQAFGERIADLCKVRHAIPVVNATSGLEVVARSLGLTGEVIVPAFTFVATAHAMKWIGLEPVFCDVCPDDYTLDPDLIDDLVTPTTTAILAVHLWGRPCDTEAIEAKARQYGLKVIYDAAHAFGVSRNGRPLGNFGNAEVFSFHATKFVNSLEGGAITTNDDALAEKVRLSINFGFAGYDRIERLGMNAKMNEFSAAMGLTVLESLEEILAINRDRYATYVRELAGLEGIKVIEYAPATTPNYQYLALEVDAEAFGIDRDLIVEALHAENVLARRYFSPGLHRVPPYQDARNSIRSSLPNTERLANCMMCLPCGTSVSATQVKLICELLRRIQCSGETILRQSRSTSA